MLCQEFLWRRGVEGGGGHTVAQFFEAQRYKPEGRGFHSRWCHRKFSLTWSFRSHHDPGDYSASNRNEYQEYFVGDKGGRCVGLTEIPSSCTNCLEVLVPSNWWNPQGLYRGNLTFFLNEFQKRTLYEIYQIKYFSRMWLVTPVFFFIFPVLVRRIGYLMLFVLFFFKDFIVIWIIRYSKLFIFTIFPFSFSLKLAELLNVVSWLLI